MNNTNHPVTHCLSLIGGKWKPAILFEISNGGNRFGAMSKALVGINKQMLSKQLRELEADELIDREVFAEIPPRVEYTLTKKGKSLLPIVKAMQVWGEADLALPEASKDNRDQFMLPI